MKIGKDGKLNHFDREWHCSTEHEFIRDHHKGEYVRGDEGRGIKLSMPIP